MSFRQGERFKAHSELSNRRLLWHGTNVAVVVAILKSGLRIMPHSGGRVGRGIYFASENGKSSCYGTLNALYYTFRRAILSRTKLNSIFCYYLCVIIVIFFEVGTSSKNIGIMFLVEVALGKEHEITMDNSSLKSAPKGFDSVVARGRTEPSQY